MKKHKILKAYTVQYTDPVILNVGETVKLGEEEKDEKWKGWIWAETGTNKGWVPMQVLEISGDKTSAVVLEFYTAKELAVEEGDEITRLKQLNGWSWSKNRRTNEEGWIPDEIIG